MHRASRALSVTERTSAVDAPGDVGGILWIDVDAELAGGLRLHRRTRNEYGRVDDQRLQDREGESFRAREQGGALGPPIERGEDLVGHVSDGHHVRELARDARRVGRDRARHHDASFGAGGSSCDAFESLLGAGRAGREDERAKAFAEEHRERLVVAVRVGVEVGVDAPGDDVGTRVRREIPGHTRRRHGRRGRESATGAHPATVDGSRVLAANAPAPRELVHGLDDGESACERERRREGVENVGLGLDRPKGESALAPDRQLSRIRGTHADDFQIVASLQLAQDRLDGSDHAHRKGPAERRQIDGDTHGRASKTIREHYTSPLAMKNRSRLRSALGAALLTGLCSGCFVSRSAANPAIAPEAVARITPGSSTADDVTRILGAPNEVVQLGRRSAWRYEHTVEKQSALFLVLLGLRGVDTQADRVWIFFDDSDNVIHVGTMFQASEAEYDVPVF